MNIENIEFINHDAYKIYDGKRDHKKIAITSKNCEYQISKIQYQPYQNSLDKSGVENTMFPGVIYVFYDLIFSTWSIPSPEELLDAYYGQYNDQITVAGDKVCFQSQVFEKKDVDGRLMRTYPSLLRDFHFYLLLAESGQFDEVRYSCKTDISGKDIIVVINNLEYEVSLFVKTRRSLAYKTQKNSYRHSYETEIQVPLDLGHSRKFGDINLYSYTYMRFLFRQIQKYDARQNWDGPELNSLSEGDHAVGWYILKSIYCKNTEARRPFLVAELSDKTGELNVVVWNYKGNIDEDDLGKRVHVFGTVKPYRDKLQIESAGILLASEQDD